MTAVVCFGMTADPEELRELAEAVSARRDGWRERVDALPRYVLTPATLASERDVIAGHLRGVATFLERRRDGIPFGHPELAEYAARVRERVKGKALTRTFGGRERRP